MPRRQESRVLSGKKKSRRQRLTARKKIEKIGGITTRLSGGRASRACGGIASLFVLLPVRQDVRDTWRVGESVHILKVLLGDLKRPSSDIGDVFTNELARVDSGLVDLLEQEGAEGLDTRAKESAVEGHIDTSERNRGETTLQLDWLRLGLSRLHTLVDDIHEVRLDVLKRHRLHEGLDVNLLCLENVEQIGQGIESS